MISQKTCISCFAFRDSTGNSGYFVMIKVVSSSPRKAYGGMEEYLHAFVTGTLCGGLWSTSCTECFILGEKFSAPGCIGRCVGPRVPMDTVDVEIFVAVLRIKPRFLGCPHRSLATILTELWHDGYLHKLHTSHNFLRVAKLSK
jgi:hypothetical protein